MPLKSMTGFAHYTDTLDDFSWRWEVRAVNGRGLDMRFRLGRRDALEPSLREKVAAKIGRGSLQISLAIEQEKKDTQIDIDQETLQQCIDAAKKLSDQPFISAPTADGMLALPGVMVEKRFETDTDELAVQQKALLSSFDQLLDHLNEMREKEGTQIKMVLRDQLSEIEHLSKQARDNPCRTPEMIAQRLSQQVATLKGDTDLSEDRLYTEAVLLAVKADIQEELDRIDAHAISFRNLIDGDGPVGRKLEFLTQELAREANTLCSKANDPGLTQTGLTLKTVIDQMREQILNLE